MDFVIGRALDDLDRLAGRDVAECLGRPARGPRDGQLRDALRVEQADGLDQAVAAEAGIVADRCGGSTATGRRRSSGRPGSWPRGPPGWSWCRSASLLATARLEAGVLKQGVVSPVAGRRAAQLDKEVEIAVGVPVGERDSVPLLKVARCPSSWWRRRIDNPSMFLNKRLTSSPSYDMSPVPR